MTQTTKRSKISRKKKFQKRSDATPAGKITIGEIVKISSQPEKDVSKVDQNNKASPDNKLKKKINNRKRAGVKQ